MKTNQKKYEQLVDLFEHSDATLVELENSSGEPFCKTNFDDNAIEVTPLFALLHPVLQEYIIHHATITMGYYKSNDMNSFVSAVKRADTEALYKIKMKHSEKYSMLIFELLTWALKSNSAGPDRIKNFYVHLL
jgi:hypothetical protein